MQQNSEVDINVLVNLYHTKLAAALNQNVLLEAKLQTLKNDFEKEKNELLEQLANYTDSDGDTKSRGQLINFGLRKLGYPVLEINLDTDQIHDALDDTIQIIMSVIIMVLKECFLNIKLLKMI